MEHYERLGKIGEGTSGIVYKARDRRTGETVAIKRLRAGAGNGNADGDAFDETFRREVRCLEACRGHPCLVELRAAHRDPAGGGAFLVMEYAGRSLAEAMRQQDSRGERRPFPEPEARRVMRRLLEGVAAMHARGLLHRDLKPDNVLLDGRGGVKICDFGLSRAADAGTGAAPYTSGVATLWYRAPELILGSGDYDAGVDTWALGCIMAELLSGGAPLFAGRSEMDQLNRVFDTLGMQDMASWPGFARLPRAGSPLCQRSRPPSRLRELFPALSAAGFDVLGGLLACRPDRRLTAADALRCLWFADAAAAVPEAVPDQPRASCCAAGFAAGVAGVAEAIVA
jgi:cell division cycle 2-like protein